MPPAGTVFCVHPVCTPPENTGLQQPTWIVPGVLGARCLFEIRPSVGEDRERPRGAIVVAGKDAGPVACSAREGPRTPPAAASARELQGELLVGHALERQPVQRRDAQTLDGVAVLGRRVADVGAELPAGVPGVGAVHEPIAADLGDDRGGGDGRARCVAVDDRAWPPRPASSAPAIHRTPSRRSNWKSRRPVCRFGRGRRELGAAAGMGASSPAGATTGSAAGSLTTRTTVTGAPADPLGPSAPFFEGVRARTPPGALEEPDALRRPVRREGAADDPAARDGAPEAAVIRLATVVAHHEPMAGGNGDGSREVASAALTPLARLGDVAVLLALAVPVNVPPADVDRVARPGDDTLDEVHARALGRRAVA